MALSATATRMQKSLPSYYEDNPIIERVLQARANEIDRMDARIDVLKHGLIPGTATDELRLLSAWEYVLELPVAPPDATVSQRQAVIRAALRRRNAISAADVMDLLTAAIGANYSIARNTPAQLEDTITIPYAPGSYLAAQVEAIARAAWSAHRRVFIHYAEGFILEVSRLDEDTL
jgi:hypothetical protein